MPTCNSPNRSALDWSRAKDEATKFIPSAILTMGLAAAAYSALPVLPVALLLGIPAAIQAINTAASGCEIVQSGWRRWKGLKAPSRIATSQQPVSTLLSRLET